MSKEAIIAELQRRGVQPPQQSTIRSDKQAILTELKKRGVQPPEKSTTDKVIGGLEAAATVISGAAAEPIAGLAGVAQAINPFSKEGAAAETVSTTRDLLTYKPVSQSGKESTRKVGEVLAPVGEALESTRKLLGDKVFKETDSPTLAAAAATLPDAIIEAIGFGVGGKFAKSTKAVQPSNKAVKNALKQAAPSSNKLKEIAGGIYDELENSGVKLKETSAAQLLKNVEVKAKRVSARTAPVGAGLLDDLKEVLKSNPTLNEIRDLRSIAKDVASSPAKREARVGSVVVNQIDDFLNNLSESQLSTGKAKAGTIGKKIKIADNLWGRARKSELIIETIDKAKNRASGFENGLRIEFDKIINNKKLSRYFNDSELAIMKDLVRGDLKQNIPRLFGKFGTLGGRDQNALGALVAGGVGASTGGLPGFIAAVSIGSAARKVAQNITKGKADFLNNITKAGNNGKSITRAYLNVVPKSKRSVVELSELLSDPKVNLEELITSSNKLVKEAAEIAAGRQAIGQAAGALAVGEMKNQENK